MTAPKTATALHDEAEKVAAEAAFEAAAKAASSFRHPSLAAALVAALADITVVAAAQTANLGTYSYKYADIADVVKLTRPALAAHGLVALTPVHDHGNGLACTVKIVHEAGETLDLGPFPFPHGRDAQATGSMVTYHRRYALVAALGIAAGDDDDGAAAKPREAKQEPDPPMDERAARLYVRQLADMENPDDEKAAKALAGKAWDALAGTPWTPEALYARFTAWVNAEPEAGEGTA